MTTLQRSGNSIFIALSEEHQELARVARAFLDSHDPRAESFEETGMASSNAKERRSEG